MRLQIFDVEPGACARVTADNNTRLMIDCGHNGITGCKPGTYLRQQGITRLEMLAITNYDEDHSRGAIDYSTTFSWIGSSATKAFQVNDPGLERRFSYNRYPTFDDENNLSMALFLKCHGTGVMFPGDLEVNGFEHLLRSESFRQALTETNIYVASHHGRENGCSDAVASHLTRAF